MMRGVFITGTGTDVGKTYVTALLVKKLRTAGLTAGYYKAALSGAGRGANGLIPGDADYVCRMSQIDGDPSRFVTAVYEHAVSPHLAAQWEGDPVTLEAVAEQVCRLSETYDYLTAEGSGGIICPLSVGGKRDIFLKDVIQFLGIPVIIVAPSGLGTINDTLLTVHYARCHGMVIRGVILNHWQGGPLEEDNVRMIEKYGDVPVLAMVRNGAGELPVSVSEAAGWYEEVHL